MFLFPFMGLGLAKLHAVGTAAWIGNRYYRRCRNCRRYYNSCPYNKNSCPGEGNNVNCECQ